MEHTTFIASLTAAQKATLHSRSTAKGLLHLAGHLGALLIMGSYIAMGGPFWGLMLVPYGITLMFLFTLAHECTHATPFAHRRLNEVIGHATALPLMQPFLAFRYFHLAHHKYTNDPDRDPELAMGGRPNTWRAYVLYLSGWPYWHGSAQLLVRHAMGQITADYLPQKRHRAMMWEARLLILCYALLLSTLVFSTALLWLLILPALIGQPFLRLYLLAEHGHCPAVANMLENTRTTLTNRVVRFLAWNMPYHAEHHAMPQVPFHALPMLHGEIKPHLKSLSPSYRDFTRRYADALSR